MQEEEKAQYAARQEAFFSNVKTWNEANSGKVLVFQGNPQNLIDKSVLGECDYIVIPALTATSADKMSFSVRVGYYLIAGLQSHHIRVAMLSAPFRSDETALLTFTLLVVYSSAG